MRVLEADVANSRREAALAADVAGRLLVLTEEIERMVVEDRRLADVAGIEPERAEAYPGLDEILRIYGPGVIAGKDATFADGSTIISLDQVLMITQLQREANLRTLGDARREREVLAAGRSASWETLNRHKALAAQWAEGFANWDPGLGGVLAKLEDEERDLLQRMMRLEEAEAAAREAERALTCLGYTLQDAVEWVGGDAARAEPARAILSMERLARADPWIFESQIQLMRARWALLGTVYLGAGAFQVDLLTQFAGMFTSSLGRDISEQDGTSRSSRAVTWTLTTVRALRGYATRSLMDGQHALERLRSERSKMLSKSRD